MTDQISDVDAFVERRSRRPVWIIAWTLFVAAASFAANTLIGISQENALISQDRAVATAYTQLGAKLEGLTKMLSILVSGATSALTFFEKEIEQAKDLRGIDRKTVSEAHRLIRESRNANDVFFSVTGSIQMRDSDADSLIAKFRDDIRAIDQTLLSREQVADALLVGNWMNARTLMLKVRADPDGHLRQQLTAFSFRVDELGQLAGNRKQAFAADLEARSVRRSQYRMRVYLTYAALAYMGALAAYALSAWRRERRAAPRSATPEN